MASSGKVHYAHKPDSKWEKEGLNRGYDVAFTPDGKIAVCDAGRKTEERRVLLYNESGDLVANSTEQGIEFEDGPYGVTYDSHESCLIVVQGNCLVFLDPSTLAKKNKMYLDDEDKARGIGVLSDGTLVVTADTTPGAVCLYNRDGDLLQKITEYDGQKMISPYYVTVMPNDVILVSFSTKMALFSSKLEFLKIPAITRKVSSPKGTTYGNKSDILVARYPNGVHHVKEVGGEWKEKNILEIRALRGIGEATSVAVNGSKMAVLWLQQVHLYEF